MQKIIDYNTQSLNEKYWDEFYKTVEIDKESSFCNYIKNKIDKNAIILDLGCGSGRDSFSFAREGFNVIGIDRSKEAIEFNQSLKRRLHVQRVNVEFYRVDINDKNRLSELMILLRNRGKLEGKSLVVYLRFVLHSITEQTEEILLTTISDYLSRGSYFAAEFRTIEDELRNKVYGNHYRRFIDSEKLLNDLQYKYNFKIISFTKGTGLSIFKDEDPYLGRIVAKKN